MRLKTNLTERENCFLVLDGKKPEWVPFAENVFCGCMHRFLLETKREGNIQTDIFGTRYIQPDPLKGPIPEPGKPQLKDITQWHSVTPFFDYTKLDWKEEAAHDTAHWDRVNKISSVMIGGSSAGCPFNVIVSMMSHEGALMSMLTEEDAFLEFMDYITGYYEGIIRYTAEYYKPDIIMIGDDVATKLSTFMSPDMYRTMIKPFHKRLMYAIIENNCIPALHCCGKVDAIVDDFVEIGVRVWNPAQVFNNLKGIKEKYGNSFVIQGAWDSEGPPALKGADEKTVRGAVRKVMDELAPGGGFIFSPCGMLEPTHVGQEHFNWVVDEANTYGRRFYQNSI